MEEFVKGDVVVLPFPYTNLMQSKNRPALVLASLKGDDFIMCQITSQQRVDDYAILLTDKDFSEGKLQVLSTIRPNILFTVEKSLIKYAIGKINRKKMLEVEDILLGILKG